MELDNATINDAMAAELRAEKAAHKLSVRVLSERSGLTVVTLNRILRGERSINVDQLYRLSAVFGVEAKDLAERATNRLGGMEALIASAEARAARKGVDMPRMSEGAPNNVTALPRRVEDMSPEEIEAQRHAATQDEEMDQPEQFD